MKLNIKNRVDKLGISKNKLAQQLEISYPTMLDMYNGESTSIKLETLEKLCDILTCTPNDILISDSPQIFISYSHKDDEYANQLRSSLEKILPKEDLKRFGVQIQTDKNGNKIAIPYILLEDIDISTPTSDNNESDTE